MGASDWPVDLDAFYGCWLWRGAKAGNGYGKRWSSDGLSTVAHVAVYQAEVGPIPEGHELDHACRDRLCVNPAHLEPLTKSENLRRRSWAHRSQVRRCKAGHDLSRHGRRTRQGGRVCLVCSGLKPEPQTPSAREGAAKENAK